MNIGSHDVGVTHLWLQLKMHVLRRVFRDIVYIAVCVLISLCLTLVGATV